MGGKILEYEAKTIRNASIAEGEAQGQRVLLVKQNKKRARCFFAQKIWNLEGEGGKNAR